MEEREIECFFDLSNLIQIENQDQLYHYGLHNLVFPAPGLRCKGKSQIVIMFLKKHFH